MPIDMLEAAVLRRLLAGTHPVLIALERQLAGIEVTERKFTGVGFYTSFSVSETIAPAIVPAGGSPFGDVAASIPELKHGAGFLLWLRNGRIHELEGYAYDEPWPEKITEFSLSYLELDRRSVLAKLG